ncbi:alcohol acetyltransferase-domain-containing protein [Xylariaceae sp. FL0016]|nr:alcohol acetyltransferase-domain-containing protein [Xylariaceae sp. FL0016]
MTACLRLPTSPSKAKPNIIRKLGGLEQYESAIQTLRFYGNTMVACRYLIPNAIAYPASHAEVAKSLEIAIAQTVLDHAELRIGMIRETSSSPAWVHLDHVDLDYHIDWRVIDASADLEQVLQEVIHQQTDVFYSDFASRPGWKVVVLRKEGSNALDVLFGFNHANADGTGGKIFHEDLLQHLGTPQSKETDLPLENHILRIPATAPPLASPIEKLAKLPISPKFALSTLWHELKPAFLQGKAESQYKAAWAPISALPYRSQFRHFHVPHHQLQKILAACRAHQTTLTGLFHALLIASLAKRLDATQAPALTSTTAMNMRRHVAPSSASSADDNVDIHRCIGNYVSVLEHAFDPPAVSAFRTALAKDGGGGGVDADASPALLDLIWRSATRVRAELQARLDMGLRDDMLGLMRFVPDWRQQFRDYAGKPRRHAVCVTNLGVIDGRPPPTTMTMTSDPEKGTSWRIERATFPMAAEVTASAMTLCAVAVKGGELTMGLVWQDCVLDVEFCEGVMEDLERWMQYLAV